MGEQYGRTVRDLLPDRFEGMDEVVKSPLSNEPGIGRAGNCAASAQLKYGELKLHDKLQTVDLKLSDAVTLDPPLTIG